VGEGLELGGLDLGLGISAFDLSLHDTLVASTRCFRLCGAFTMVFNKHMVGCEVVSSCLECPACDVDEKQDLGCDADIDADLCDGRQN
jgi:hypothetical protein